jgi:hypothetical protein
VGPLQIGTTAPTGAKSDCHTHSSAQDARVSDTIREVRTARCGHRLNPPTLKYRPDFPDRFDSIEHARRHTADFFGWYNHRHRHSGIALMAPADVHYGRAPAITAARGQVREAAYTKHPERFVRKLPTPPTLADTVWINRAADDTGKQQLAQ